MPQSSPTGCPLHVMDFLLRCDRSPKGLAALEAFGIPYSPFLTFVLDMQPREKFLALWQKYEPQVRAEAERRGVELPNPDDYVPDGSWVRTVID